VGGFVHACHELVEALGPVVEHLGLALLLCEVNDAGGAIDFNFQCSVVDQLGEELFCFQLVEIQELSHADTANAGVVIGDDSDILQRGMLVSCGLGRIGSISYVFNQAILQFLPALLAVRSVLLEDLKIHQIFAVNVA
jgi:hypothetical protein